MKKSLEGRKILSGTDLIEERLIFFIKWKGEWIRDFSQDFLLELYQADSPVREMLTDIQTKSLTVMRDYFSQAMEQGKVNSDVSLEALMMWMNAMSVLFMDEGIKANFKSTEDMYKQLTSLYFYGITGKGKK